MSHKFIRCKSFDISTRNASSSLIEDLKALHKKAILCDIELQTATEKFQGHKMILSARSPEFRAIFTNGTIECLDIQDVDANTMHHLLLYMYTDTLKSYHGRMHLYYMLLLTNTNFLH
ncbi:hypothetical protein CEXT_99741 [Caerostris extrusa]|uniref:BTB domain-containing protein n=1 Tax=Caerostris extrusa TaxID=172846 RepID=A0AAV4SWU1_CAEEX|nr:hypothetical protein CEXT_99741 [Caerostris extrusa]